MEINLKSIKRYLRSAIKETRDVTINFYTEKFDPIYGWRIGELFEKDIMKEISNIKKGINTKIKDELTLKELGLLNEITNEYDVKINETDWRLIRNEFEIRQKLEYEKIYGRQDFIEVGFNKNSSKGRFNEEEIDNDLEDYEFVNKDFKLITSDVENESKSLGIVGTPKIDIRYIDEENSISSLTYINTQIDLKQLELLNDKISKILESQTKEIIRIEIKSINNINFLQASFIL